MSEHLSHMRKRLLIGYLIILFLVQLGLPFFYLFYSLNITGRQIAQSLLYFLFAVPLAGGVFSIYIPIRLFRTDGSYPNKVVVANAVGVSLIYIIAAVLFRYSLGYPAFETAKLPFLALSVGILQCLSSFLFTLRTIYPHMESGPGIRVSLFYKNLLFTIFVVLLGIIIVGSVAFNELEQSIKHHYGTEKEAASIIAPLSDELEGGSLSINNALLHVFFAFSVAMLIIIAISYEFTRLMNLPLKELVISAKAISAGDMKKAKAITGDEVEDLVTAFNLMLERIREREMELILRGQHLALLYSLAEALNQNKSKEDIFTLTMEWLDAVFGFEVGTLRMLKDGDLKLTASQGIPEDFAEKIDTIKLGESFTGLAALQDRIIAVEDIPASGDPHAQTAKELGLQCLISMPLRCRESLIGTLSVGSRTKRDIHHNNIEMLNSASNLLGIAIERSSAFDKMEEEKFQWETAVGFMKDIVSIHDEQWRIKKVNPAFLEHFAVKEHEVLGKHCYEVFHGASMPPAECPHMETLLTRTKSQSIMDTVGSKVLNISVHPIFKSHGAIKGSIHIARDVTEIQRLREHLQQADKLGALGRLASGIAHNVNNPLTYSLNYLYILKETAAEEKSRELVRKVEEGIGRAKNVLEGLLDLSMPSEKEAAVIDIAEIFTGILSFLSGEINRMGITVRTEFSENLKVRADEKALGEVLLNLMANAMDAQPSEISIESYRDATGVVITISDNGCGIEKNHIPQVFEPYFTTKPNGTGLGLYTSYNIIKSLGGNIWCTSKKGTGTRFFILLPGIKT